MIGCEGEEWDCTPRAKSDIYDCHAASLRSIDLNRIIVKYTIYIIE